MLGVLLFKNSFAYFLAILRDEFRLLQKNHNAHTVYTKTRLPCPIFREQWQWIDGWVWCGNFLFLSFFLGSLIVCMRVGRKGADNLCNCTQYLSHSMKAMMNNFHVCRCCFIVALSCQDPSHQMAVFLAMRIILCSLTQPAIWRGCRTKAHDLKYLLHFRMVAEWITCVRTNRWSSRTLKTAVFDDSLGARDDAAASTAHADVVAVVSFTLRKRFLNPYVAPFGFIPYKNNAK